MEFEAVLEQTITLLQRQGRISYGALKRRFQLDDAYLEDLKVELIEAQQLARDENGRILVWAGETASQPPTRDDQVIQAALPHVERRTPDAERRQITVMFCDLVDSTALSSQLDPEDFRDVVRAYQDASTAVIQRFDGYIAQLLGDGLLVYFGYPYAHEDDAQRAVRAGLGLVQAMGALNVRLAQHRGVRLAVRIGIHTGLVVVGEMGSGNRQEQLALGEIPNVAARIQGLAAPDTVAISYATFRLVRGYVTYQDLGAHLLKGLVAPFQVYRILGESDAQSRLDVAGAIGFTPLVGRDAEVTLLLERWAHSQDGTGQVVLLRGEAGIGKSRLVEVLRERVASEGATRMVFRCSPDHQNSALYPVIDHLQRFLHWQRDEAPEAKFATLERVLQKSRLPLEDVVPLFAALLSVPLPERYPPLTLTPQRQRQKTQEALVAWLLQEAERQPVLAVWEDLHWADPSTLELLSLMLDQVPTARILTLLTCRPEFPPPWTTRSQVTQVILNRLGRPQVEVMLTSLTDGKALPPEVVEQVVAKTDGVPLFVEELVKMILESGLVREEDNHYELTGLLPPLAIPSTLHDSLMARLDRLSMARELAQLGAVLGREFAYDLLQAVSPVDEMTLQQGLAQLVEAELVYQRGLPPHSRYLFKHALIQDTAYQSLLKSTRQQYHQRIAQVLTAQFPETVETQPELVAYHYTGAGLSEAALPYWQRAGQRAIEHSAYLEAIAHLTRGLEVLRPLSDMPEHTRQELTLQLTLGVALLATKGYTAPEVAQVYTRARDLCQHLGDVHQLSQVLRGQWMFYAMGGDYQTARPLGEHLLTLAQGVHAPVLFLEAHRTLGLTLLWLGELEAARQHLDHALARYDRQQHRTLAAMYGTDPGAAGLMGMAWTLQVLGYPEQAMQKHREALALVREIAHPFSFVVVSIFAAIVHMLRREWSLAQEHAEVLIALDVGISQQWRVAALYLSGAILGMQGHIQEGITQMCQEIEAWRASGAGLFLSHWLALLAEAYGQLGQTDVALQTVAEALAHVDNRGEGYYTAEIYRLQGELLLQASTRAAAAGDALPHAVPENLRAPEAEACFQQALAMARRQQAKSWELRAATSLSRLWQRQGKRNEARQLLAEIYAWFTEGFDTADLQEAKALLEELT